MLINKSYKYRIYPNEKQRELINKTLGCVRFVYNHFLYEWNKTYETTKKGMSYNQCSSLLTILKRQDETIWLKEVDKFALQNAIKNLAEAFKSFYKKAKRKPRFKTKKNPVQSYRTNIQGASQNVENTIINGRVKLPKLGMVKIKYSRNIEGRIINAKIKKTHSGKYFVVLTTEEADMHQQKTGSTIGIDLGLKDFAVLSDGTTYRNQRHFINSQKKLAREQRKLSRRQRLALTAGRELIDCKNYQKQRVKVSIIQERIANQRNDFLQKTTTDIVKNHDVIGIEDLKVDVMKQQRKFSKQISDVSWSKFRAMLEYKAKWRGVKVVVVARNFPSSQMCSNCGYKNAKVKNLALRSWECPECKTQHDRDLNAAQNLKKEATRILASKTVGSTGLA